MIYAITLLGIKNNILINKFKAYDFKSDIISINPIKNEQLINDICNHFKDSEYFKECDNLIVEEISASHIFIKRDFNTIPDELKSIYEESVKSWKEAEQECDKQLLDLKYSNILEQIKDIRNEVENKKLLDSQEYLNFLDELNKLSIDLDR